METGSESQYYKAVEDEYLKSLPAGGFQGKILVVDNPGLLKEAGMLLANESILGFDTETRPSFKKGRYHRVALLQLATEDMAFLFRLNKVHLQGAVIKILENPAVTKVGVALRDDLNGLQKIMPLKPDGFVDLQQYVKQFGIEDNGLKKLVANILGFRISKRFQTSNWEQEVLSQEQLGYAATDAWACLEIYKTLIRHL